MISNGGEEKGVGTASQVRPELCKSCGCSHGRIDYPTGLGSVRGPTTAAWMLSVGECDVLVVDANSVLTQHTVFSADLQSFTIDMSLTQHDKADESSLLVSVSMCMSAESALGCVETHRQGHYEACRRRPAFATGDLSSLADDVTRSHSCDSRQILLIIA